jgi:hypothetical protein
VADEFLESSLIQDGGALYMLFGLRTCPVKKGAAAARERISAR